MAEPLLDARGLSKTFSSGRGGSRREVRAVQAVDIRVDAGETLGLVGESGSGKSTTGRILLRLIEPDAGTATFRGQDLFALSGAELREMRRHIQLVYQDPSLRRPRFRAQDIVAEPWAIHRLYDRDERHRRADALLERVGVDPSSGDRRPASFSGGQLQRIGVARAMALEPEVLICDEPVSALDVSVQAQVVNLLEGSSSAMASPTSSSPTIWPWCATVPPHRGDVPRAHRGDWAKRRSSGPRPPLHQGAAVGHRVDQRRSRRWPSRRHG